MKRGGRVKRGRQREKGRGREEEGNKEEREKESWIVGWVKIHSNWIFNKIGNSRVRWENLRLKSRNPLLLIKINGIMFLSHSLYLSLKHTNRYTYTYTHTNHSIFPSLSRPILTHIEAHKKTFLYPFCNS